MVKKDIEELKEDQRFEEARRAAREQKDIFIG